MSTFLPILIAVAGLGMPDGARYPDSSQTFLCTFDQSADENFDRWPDEWTRRRGREFPHYVSIEIVDEPSPVSQRCLRVDLDGGGAVAYSPPIEIGPLNAFVLETLVKTEGLKHDRAFLSLTLLDRERQRLETHLSEKVRDTDGWERLRLGPVTPNSDDVRYAVIGLHLEPQSREDLTGSACFADVWLGRVLRMSLETPTKGNFFLDPTEVKVTCNASGFSSGDLNVAFELQDIFGRIVAAEVKPLSVVSVATDSALTLDALADHPTGFKGKTSWRPAVPRQGYYRLKAMISGRGSFTHQRELSLVVLDPDHVQPRGEFGWTLPDGDKPLPLTSLAQLLGQVGVNWVKYPLWFEETPGQPTGEQIVSFYERLASRNIEMVGLLCVPPEKLRERFAEANSLSAAEVFSASPQLWYPSLEPIMTRFVTQIRWWQLGHDRDTSFVEYPQLNEKIAEIKNQIDRFAQDINLVFGWSWMNELPRATGDEKSPPWRGLALSTWPAMTHKELTTYLDASSDAASRRWVVLEPLSKKRYPLETRANDLVRRMIAAKTHGADAIFCPQPFDDDCGLMNADGTPGELLMPWRTTALAIGGGKYLGSITLPGGSQNMVFARDDSAVMVVWNDEPREEVLYLGEDAQQVDIWGQAETPELRGHRQVIAVGPTPSFVTGMDLLITQWRMGVKLAHEQMPSVFGVKHGNSLSLTNHYGEGIAGRAELIVPERWMINPQQFTFRLADREKIDLPFDLTLPYDASSGEHKIRVDFQLGSSEKQKFSVYRRIDVGTGEVEIEIATRLNAEGQLEVEQRFINNSNEEANFRCQLFAPGRVRQRAQVIGLTAGDDKKVYRIPDGEELLGQTLWIRAQEMTGPRILNYRFKATP